MIILIYKILIWGFRHPCYFFKHDTGATAVEYSLILALIAAVIIVTVETLGISVFGTFSDYINLYDSVNP